MQVYNEIDVIGRIQQGNVSLFDALLRPYQRLVFANMLAFLHRPDEAEELTQETLAIVLTRLWQLKDAKKFRSWILHIAYNLAKRRARQERRLIFKSFEELRSQGTDKRAQEPADWTSLPSAGLHRPELRAAIMSALERLPLIYREVFVRRYIQGATITETAAMLEISPACVRTRARRARIRLQKALLSVFDADGTVQ